MDRHETWMGHARCAAFPRLGWIKDRDQATTVEILTMAVCCARCEVYDECAEFADREHLTAGFWAGEFRDPPVREVGEVA